jgi:hypothetical protein
MGLRCGHGPGIFAASDSRATPASAGLVVNPSHPLRPFRMPCLGRPSSSGLPKLPELSRAPRHAQRFHPTILGFAELRRNGPQCNSAVTTRGRAGRPQMLGTGCLDSFPRASLKFLRGLPAFDGARRQPATVFDDFGSIQACPRACARGALVARTARLVGGHLDRFPSHTGHAAVAQW